MDTSLNIFLIISVFVMETSLSKLTSSNLYLSGKYEALGGKINHKYQNYVILKSQIITINRYQPNLHLFCDSKVNTCKNEV